VLLSVTVMQNFSPTANPKKNPIYQDVMDGIASPGIEFYLPLFFSHEAMQGQSTLISYLPKNGIVITDRRWSRV
jgi:Transcription-repair coupling factor (superfamily II helicase)